MAIGTSSAQRARGVSRSSYGVDFHRGLVKWHVLLEASNLDVGVQVAHVYDPGVVLEQAGWRWAVRARSYDGYKPSGTSLGEMRNRAVDQI